MNLLDYGWRSLDPQIARWTSIDPLAAYYSSWSPYNYVRGNPISRIDPNGMWDDWYDDDYYDDEGGNPNPWNSDWRGNSNASFWDNVSNFAKWTVGGNVNVTYLRIENEEERDYDRAEMMDLE